jgi:hypothetical protein
MHRFTRVLVGTPFVASRVLGIREQEGDAGIVVDWLSATCIHEAVLIHSFGGIRWERASWMKAVEGEMLAITKSDVGASLNEFQHDFAGRSRRS